MGLIDSYQRQFVYLRLSVTDRCNFKCSYCLPNGYEKDTQDSSELSVFEVKKLVTAFANAGVEKIRITGGEPTVRRDLINLVQTVSEIPGIKKVAMTTNGYRLFEMVRSLKAAGLQAINVSIDSLDSEKFHQITGSNQLFHILKGVEESIRLGLEVKINTVLLKDQNEDDFDSFFDWVKDHPVTVRFIELMQTGKNTDYFKRKHVSGGTIKLKLMSQGWVPSVRGRSDGPAVVFEHQEYAGKIGIIAPYADGFCETCNRLRITSRGELRMCLFGEKDHSIREFLRSEEGAQKLPLHIQSLLSHKPKSHFLHLGNFGSTRNLAQMGG